MNRKDFLKNACNYSACGCTGMMLLSSANLLAENNAPEAMEDDWQIGFMQNRMAKLMEVMYSKLDNETLTALLENMGRHCAKENSEYYVKFKGDINGYLENLKEWVEKIEHNEEKGTVKIAGKKNNSCYCPFVDISKMPKEFCNCTRGWNKEIYETIIGGQVDVKIDSTVLWGGESCNITLAYK
jgi:predicted ArsR family transcriptional regulator